VAPDGLTEPDDRSIYFDDVTLAIQPFYDNAVPRIRDSVCHLAPSLQSEDSLNRPDVTSRCREKSEVYAIQWPSGEIWP
jgi:hypothetical protein